MNHAEVLKNRIYNMLDKIEDKTETMAHEIPDIRGALDGWQKSEYLESKGLFLYNVLCLYWDNLNSDGGLK